MFDFLFSVFGFFITKRDGPEHPTEYRQRQYSSAEPPLFGEEYKKSFDGYYSVGCYLYNITMAYFFKALKIAGFSASFLDAIEILGCHRVINSAEQKNQLQALLESFPISDFIAERFFVNADKFVNVLFFYVHT